MAERAGLRASADVAEDAPVLLGGGSDIRLPLPDWLQPA